MTMTFADEEQLDDEHPVYGDYLYVVDGRVVQSDVFGTVRDLRRCLIRRGETAEVVRRCNIPARAAALQVRA